MNSRLLHAYDAVTAGVQHFVPPHWRPAVARNRAWLAGGVLVLVALLIWYLFFYTPPAQVAKPHAIPRRTCPVAAE